MHSSNTKKPIPIACFAAVLFVCGCGSAAGQENAVDVEATVTELGDGFSSGHVDVNGTKLHYVRGGGGPTLLLLHGFPENWSAYSELMPQLAQSFSVIAVDLRGIGRSTATAAGYDAETQAEDIAQLTAALELDDIYVSGHDLGGMVAYAFARRAPERVRGVLLLESPLPGIEPWNELKADPRMWHFGFHQTPNLPEKLLAGREYTYLREGFLTSDRISDAKVRRYARAYEAPDHLRAGLEYYRAFPASEAFLEAERSANDIPFVVAGADSVFGPIGEQIAAGMRAHGCQNVSVETITDSGHYVMDDQPKQVISLIKRNASL
jgi:pimeloyl-ACP methyl ester carboxylesterase